MFFSRVHLKIICSSLFPLKSLSIFLVWLFTHLPFYRLLLWALINATTKSLTVSMILTKPYSSFDSLVILPFLCVNWKFTFCLSDWHLPFLSFSLCPCHLTQFIFHCRSSSHPLCPPSWSSLQIHVFTPSTQAHVPPPQCPSSILFRSPYSSTPYRIDSTEKERESTEG